MVRRPRCDEEEVGEPVQVDDGACLPGARSHQVDNESLGTARDGACGMEICRSARAARKDEVHEGREFVLPGIDRSLEHGGAFLAEGHLNGCERRVSHDVTARICQDEREKSFSAHNPQAVRLWRACKTCPNNPKREAR